MEYSKEMTKEEKWVIAYVISITEGEVWRAKGNLWNVCKNTEKTGLCKKYGWTQASVAKYASMVKIFPTKNGKFSGNRGLMVAALTASPKVKGKKKDPVICNKWLDKAVKKGWTAKVLKEEIKNSLEPKPEPVVMTPSQEKKKLCKDFGWSPASIGKYASMVRVFPAKNGRSAGNQDLMIAALTASPKVKGKKKDPVICNKWLDTVAMRCVRVPSQ